MTLIEQLEKVKEHADVILGCFDAACGEGLYDRLAEADTHDVGSLADLIQRRLLFAHEPARGALELLDTLIDQVKAIGSPPVLAAGSIDAESLDKAARASGVITVKPNEDQWQPIESAPRDGTEILAYWDQSRCHGIVGWFGCWMTSDDAVVSAPTYWMPLSAGPLPKVAAGSESL